MNQPETIFVHFIWIALPVMLTIVCSMIVAAWFLSRKIGALTTLFKEFRLHIHSEKEGPLRSEGILFSRTTNGEK
jgi:hypothetical protein